MYFKFPFFILAVSLAGQCYSAVIVESGVVPNPETVVEKISEDFVPPLLQLGDSPVQLPLEHGKLPVDPLMTIKEPLVITLKGPVPPVVNPLLVPLMDTVLPEVGHEVDSPVLPLPDLADSPVVLLTNVPVELVDSLEVPLKEVPGELTETLPLLPKTPVVVNLGNIGLQHPLVEPISAENVVPILEPTSVVVEDKREVPSDVKNTEVVGSAPVSAPVNVAEVTKDAPATFTAPVIVPPVSVDLLPQSEVVRVPPPPTLLSSMPFRPVVYLADNVPAIINKGPLPAPDRNASEAPLISASPDAVTILSGRHGAKLPPPPPPPRRFSFAGTGSENEKRLILVESSKNIYRTEQGDLVKLEFLERKAPTEEKPIWVKVADLPYPPRSIISGDRPTASHVNEKYTSIPLSAATGSWNTHVDTDTQNIRGSRNYRSNPLMMRRPNPRSRFGMSPVVRGEPIPMTPEGDFCSYEDEKTGRCFFYHTCFDVYGFPYECWF